MALGKAEGLKQREPQKAWGVRERERERERYVDREREREKKEKESWLCKKLERDAYANLCIYRYAKIYVCLHILWRDRERKLSSNDP